jgi:hypothetical protein
MKDMKTRRDFIRQAMAAGAACLLPHEVFSQTKPGQGMIWANLLHLSYNMWEDTTPLKYADDDYPCASCQEAREWAHGFRRSLTFDESLWNILLKEMAAAGMNMVVIDLGDAVLYDSHPEIAVRKAWTPDKLRDELAKMRKMGLEPIPKLNFATTHDTWMGEYAYMVSSQKYYEVCRDLIGEVIDIFGAPRFFHLGMDEETAEHQRNHNYTVIRRNNQWWGDMYFLIGEVEKRNVRAWIWSDYAWHYPDVFFRKMPQSVLQSNWYYGSEFTGLEGLEKRYVSLYEELEAHGYDQIPTGSNHSHDTNMASTVEHCKKRINPARLYGFMTAPWRPTLTACTDRHKEAIRQMKTEIENAKKWK